ncbi:MAG: OmpA family protein [Flavobacteriaceae bacterium]|nr:OmpA family protein [Flavobacteriaceae bacterium]
MRFLVLFFALMQFLTISAQEEMVYSVFFDTNKTNIKEHQQTEVIAFIKQMDSTRVESIQIYGYCDDVGKEDYNKKLSTDRAQGVHDYLVNSGVKNKIIVTIEGKGRVLIEDDMADDVTALRSKNRRVDVVINLLPAKVIPIPGVYNNFKAGHIVGDRIMLSDILFERGSSVLPLKCKNELDKMARMLHRHKNLHIEIQGHVCCTPPHHTEAIDKATKKRKLSHNRAENVYKYLVFKKIPKERMIFKGYGNTQPLGGSPDLDRRVEMVITKI